MTGPELWEKAKRLIPGGNQLLSKRAEMYAPGLWPAYYERAEGCRVWADGREYLDFTTNGLGACPLGYAHPKVNHAVIQAMQNGSMATLNCREEVELAERLIDLHPWSDQARFARTGGEAMAVAVRIARAATGRDRVLIGGYHGWHDWYLAANLSSYVDAQGRKSFDALKNVLLPGLNADGVPLRLADTANVLHHNKVGEFEAVMRDDVAAVVIEVQRGEAPTQEWLSTIRKACDRLGAVLIVDEITSGFRKNLGGVHLLYDLEPDIAVFGKALGNGVPIAAIIGKREVMEHAQHTFISSTFWTERLGFVAALATLEALVSEDAIARNEESGHWVQWNWREAAYHYGLSVNVGHKDMTPLSHCYMPDDALKTLRCQLMLDEGILDGGDYYATLAHSKSGIIGQYAEAVDRVFSKLAEAERNGNALDLLRGPVCHSRFERLTS